MMKRYYEVKCICITILIIGVVANADIGRLDIMNKIYGGYQTGVDHKAAHYPGGTEGYDSGLDSPYNFIGIPPVSKIASTTEDPIHPELGVDVRSENSKTIVNYEISIDFGSEYSGIITTDNQLKIEIDATNKGWVFGDESITLQITQMNGDPNMVGNVYDIRKEEYYGAGVGIINLPYLEGIYYDEEVYGKFSVYFDRNLADFNNDRIINLQDFSLLAQEWGKTGNSLADIAIAEGNTGIVLPGTTTPYFDGVVDLADVMYFADNWLVEY